MYCEDTIAAISTPAGEGGIGIIRISGGDAERIVTGIMRNIPDGGLQSHRFLYGVIVDPESGGALDEVMLVLMRAPRSYTREDVVELQCHGGTLITERILDLVLSRGARLASPGEFTKRAFLNGRIDLLQAEAVIDIIRSRTDAALHQAQGQREGELSRRVTAVRDKIVAALAVLEAHIDFPEDELDLDAEELVAGGASLARQEIATMLQGFEEGRVLREGVSVLIAGKPNVGKSSLLNILLREKRAIVTAIPGTTRDVIEEVITMGGLPVKLMDTAGVRKSDDLVEREGIMLTLDNIPRADLVLFVVDQSRPFDDDDRALLEAMSGARHHLVIRNKVDLPQQLQLPDVIDSDRVVDVSTATGCGIDRLRDRIVREFVHGHATDRRNGVLISRARHRDALEKAAQSLARFDANVIDRAVPELLAIDLREALSALGEVTGQTTVDELLELIFSQFCIGK